jgi:hypothetical protein
VERARGEVTLTVIVSQFLYFVHFSFTIALVMSTAVSHVINNNSFFN